MSYKVGGHLRETLAEAGMTIESIDGGNYILIDEDGKQELWFVSPHCACAAIVLSGGIELEFARSL